MAVPVIKNSSACSFWRGTDTEIKEFEESMIEYKLDRMNLLLKSGAPPLLEVENPGGGYLTPLFLASFYDRVDIAELIINKCEGNKDNINEDVYAHELSSALNNACEINSVQVARLIIDAGVVIKTDIHPHKAANNGSWAVLDLLYKCKPSMTVNCTDNQNRTPLHLAALKGYTPTVRYLVDKGAQLNLIDDSGRTALHLACKSSDEDVIYLLISRGSDISMRDFKGKTALFIAAEYGHENIISMLAGAGADLDQRDASKNTPLITAAINGHADTIKELILNGATVDSPDSQRQNAIERAIQNKQDSAGAALIRLHDPGQSNYVSYYVSTIEIPVVRLVKYKLEKTLIALLERMIVPESKKKTGDTILYTKYLELDAENKTPEDSDYSNNIPYLMQRMANYGSEDLAYHGMVRVLVDRKMSKFGNYVLGFKLFWYLLFLSSLYYALILAAHDSIPIAAYETPNNALLITRSITEVFVTLYTIFNLFTECVEFFRVLIFSQNHIRTKKNELSKIRETIEEKKAMKMLLEGETLSESQISRVPNQDLIEEGIGGRLKNIVCIRVFIEYFEDKYNVVDLLGLLCIVITIILYATRQPTIWIFATFAIFFNSLRLFKIITLMPVLGTYSTIIYEILVNDVPRFFAMFVITLIIFVGCFFVALRTPYSAEGFRSSNVTEFTTVIEGIDDQVWWVLLSGLRILLEGNVFNDTNYLYFHLNWLAAFFYLAFLFLTIVVFVNVFIAQLSDTYANVRRNAKKRVAWYRLNFIVQIQKSSLLSLFINVRKRFFIPQLKLNQEELLNYFDAATLASTLNRKSVYDTIHDVTTALSRLGLQQKMTRRTQDIATKLLERKIKEATISSSRLPSRDVEEGSPDRTQDVGLVTRVIEIESKLSSMDFKLDKLLKKLN